MPVKRRASKHREHRITPEAVEAFRAGDYTALHRALNLRPWEDSPLDVDFDPPPDWANDSWPQAVELRRELMEADK